MDITLNLFNTQQALAHAQFVDAQGRQTVPHGAVTWTSDNALIVTVEQSPTDPFTANLRTVDSAVGTAVVRVQDEVGIGANITVTVTAEQPGEAVDVIVTVDAPTPK